MAKGTTKRNDRKERQKGTTGRTDGREDGRERWKKMLESNGKGWREMDCEFIC
jgi:hypothetical protein